MIAATTSIAISECGIPQLRPIVSQSRDGKLCPKAKPTVPSAVYQRAMPR